MAHPGDLLVDLVAGNLAAFARFRALRHFDLQVVGIDQVFGGHAETARGDLLDRRAFGVGRAVGQRAVAGRFLAAFAGIGFSAQAIHRPGQVGMRLVGDRAE